MERGEGTLRYDSGIAPIMLLLLVVLLVILGGGGYAVVKLASPECAGKRIDSCFSRSLLRTQREGIEREAQREAEKRSGEAPTAAPITNETNTSGDLVRRGTTDVRLTIRGDVGGTGDLRVAYDTRRVEGSFLLYGNISVTLNVNGTVDPETGAINAAVTGGTTQKVHTGPLQGTVGQSYTGTLTGTLSDLDAGSGRIALTQRVTSVEGNLATLRVGQTTNISLSWEGEPTD